MDKKEKDIILKVDNLTVNYELEDETVQAVRDVSFTLNKGKTIGLVGETGAGKTTTALAILNLIPDPPGVIKNGTILLGGENVLEKSMNEMSGIRGKEVSMIFQDPMTSLNPVFTVGDQIAEAIMIHEKLDKKAAFEKAQEMLRIVGIPGERAHEYPHQFSGGMKQRVVIAIALACNPELLIADEPTTDLDVTIQAQVLDLMKELDTYEHEGALVQPHTELRMRMLLEEMNALFSTVEVDTFPRTSKNARGFSIRLITLQSRTVSCPMVASLSTRMEATGMFLSSRLRLRIVSDPTSTGPCTQIGG